jgi:alpha-amylase
MSKPPLQEPLRLYNLFPPCFKNFEEMRDYVAQIKKMGFNAVWINPVQKASEVEADL